MKRQSINDMKELADITKRLAQIGQRLAGDGDVVANLLSGACACAAGGLMSVLNATTAVLSEDPKARP